MNAKIEELRARLKADPKSRLFLPLAEELRKAAQFSEAESVLRSGLENHPTYLSAWVSLGRICREQRNDGQAVEALTQALQVDPGNVVAARLLGDAYLALGDKVEAIKKFKLVRALLPADESLDAQIEQLDRELRADEPAAGSAASEASPFAAEDRPTDASAEVLPFAPEPGAATDGIGASEESPFAAVDSSSPAPPPSPSAAEGFSETSPFGRMPSIVEAEAQTLEADSVFSSAGSARSEAEREAATADSEPMRVEHEQSPFEEPAADFGYSAEAYGVEQPQGMHLTRAPLAADLPSPVAMESPTEASHGNASGAASASDASDIFAPADDATGQSRESSSIEPTNTVTMADLYVEQGLVAEARAIYESLLQTDPENAEVRARLQQLSDGSGTGDDGRQEKIARLQNWLSKVRRSEVTGV